MPRVQGNYRGTGTSSPISVTLGSTPLINDVLVAVIGGQGPSSQSSISSVTQSGGVIWSKATGSQYNNGTTYMNCEIWTGLVTGSSASTSISIASTGDISYGEVADVCEYKGVIISPTSLDSVAVNSGSTGYADSGTIWTTRQPLELWVGGTLVVSLSQSTATNGFTLLDGVVYNSYTSVAYLEKFVRNVGTANSETNANVGGGGSYFAGCIVALYAQETYLNYNVSGQGMSIPFRNVKRVKIDREANIVKHKIPGRGDLIQWMGYGVPTISIDGFFTGTDTIVQRTALEQFWLNGYSGSLTLAGGDFSGSYQVYLENLNPELQGGYFPSYIGQGYMPYTVKFTCINYTGSAP